MRPAIPNAYTTRQERVDKLPPEAFQSIPLGQGKGYLADFTGTVMMDHVIKVRIPIFCDEELLCLQ